MNAYELADAIEDWDSDGQWDTPAAIMLRQQADRIAELEKDLLMYKDVTLYWENQSEPVAWLHPELDGAVEFDWHFACATQGKKEKIPLYAYPPVEEQSEPVAWIEPDVIPFTHIIKAVVRREQDEQYSIPLYTTPQTKQLSDEEIRFMVVPFETLYTTYDKQADIDTVHTKFDWLGFARLIEAKVRGEK